MRRIIARCAATGLATVLGCSVGSPTGDTPSWSSGGGTGTDLEPQPESTLDATGTSTSPDNETDAEVEVELLIEPAHPVLDIVAGSVESELEFEVTAVGPDGESNVVSGRWDFDRPDLAAFEGTVLTATGLAGGLGNVTVETRDGTATTTLTLVLHIVDDPEGVAPEVEEAFEDAETPDPALDILYPYEGTVFPRGLQGPVLMWNGGGPTDIYRIRITGETFEFLGYRTVAPPARYILPNLPNDVWRQLTDSVVGDVTVEVQRYDGQRAYLPKTSSWTVSTANLRGAIYYWQVNTGDVVRISPGDAAPETFLEREEGECIACHSVSRDGSTIVATRGPPDAPYSWSLYDATSGSELFETSASSGFQAISPEGEFVVWRQWSDPEFTAPSPMVLSVADSIEPLAYLDPPGGTPTHPAWSPDGDTIAFGVREDGNGVDFTTSTLWTATVDLVTPGFADLVEIVANDPTRPVLTYPTFSPDSAWIAFMRGTHSRTRNADAELWLASRDGSVELFLEAANGGEAIPSDQRHTNYQPTFSPVASGGYFWLVFVSVRPYGNLLVDEDPQTRLKQLWVTAIDASPTPGEDPSHPAFWLPGQEIDNNNMRGNWALSPCKALGASCEAGFECCEGFCIDDPNGAGKICAVPEGCARIDDGCETSSDCCDDTAVCLGGFCAEPSIP